MKKLNIKTIAFAGVLIAMNLVLARVLAINIGPTLRITLSTTPIFLAGLWFGPVVGGICGVSADLLGCILQGYAPNPFILVTSLLSGVLPAVMKKHLFHNRINPWKIAVIVAVTTVALLSLLGRYTAWWVLWALPLWDFTYITVRPGRFFIPRE